MVDLRIHLLQKWLTQSCLLNVSSIEPLPGDASFRRYFRIKVGHITYIVMDAALERDSCKAFVAISHALRKQGLNAPCIVHQELALGFLLLSDFGDKTLLKVLTPANAYYLYGKALNALLLLQKCAGVEDIKISPFTAHFMEQELMLAKEWFFETHLKLAFSLAEERMLEKFFQFLAKMAAAQPQVFMHRDYHAANLMFMEEEDAIGILDFQDAFYGPVTYDLVSLLRDCYIDWPVYFVRKLALNYYTFLNLPLSREEFLYFFDLMGMQRHLKALLTFARKFERDNAPKYLQYIPRTLNYLVKVSASYPETRDFYQFLQKVIYPAFHKRALTLCAE